MKKILFATTALIATAGMAAAEIEFSGNARFGLGYVEDADQGDDRATDNDVRVEQRLRFQVRGTAETDAGVELSARFRAEAGESADSSISGGGFGAAEFSVKYGGFGLFLGNTSNVFDSGDQISTFGPNGIGFTSFLEQNENFGTPTSGFGSGDADATTLKIGYVVGDFSVSASYRNDESLIEQGDTALGTVSTFNDEEEFQIGVGYTFGDHRVGLAYSDTDVEGGEDEEFVLFGIDGSFGDLTYSVLIGDSDLDDTDTAFGASLGYAISSATTVVAVISEGGADANDTSYGIGARHSLGGGVTLAGGIGQNSADQTVADLGVSFSF